MYYKKRRESEIRDPFLDLLDLAESVRLRLKWMRLLTFFGLMGGGLLALIFLLLGVVWVLNGRVDPSLVILVFLLAAGNIIVLVASMKMEDFFLFFEKRLDSIAKTRDFDATPKIPDGTSPVDKIASYLGTQDKLVREALDKGRALRSATVAVRDSTIAFDGYLFVRRYRRASTQIFVRVSESLVSTETLDDFKKDVEAIAGRARRPPSRVILLQTGGSELSEDVVEWSAKNWIVYPTKALPGRERHACPIEVFRETPEGRYEISVFYVG